MDLLPETEQDPLPSPEGDEPGPSRWRLPQVRLPKVRFPQLRLPQLRPPQLDWRRVLRVVAGPWVTGLVASGALAVGVLWEAWQEPTKRVIGSGLGDSALMMWFLRWTPKAVGQGLNPLFTDYLNFPHGVNVMWNTSLLLPGLILGPFTVRYGPAFTFNLLSTLALALSAWCAMLALRRYIKNNLAVIIGGLVYGFSPYMLAQDRGHLQQSVAFLPPLLFLALDNLLVGQRRPALLAGAVFGIMAGCQVLIGEEVFAATALVCAAQVLIMALLFPRHILRKLPYAAIAFAAAAVAFVAVAGRPIWFQLFGPQHITGAIQQGDKYVTDLWNFITPGKVQAIIPAAAKRITVQFSGNSTEADGYLGIPLIAILVFTVARWAWSSAVVRAGFLLALVPTVLSLGDHLHIRGHDTGVKLPWDLLQRLPLLQSALPSRFMGQAMFFYGLLLAFFIERAVRSVPRWRWQWRWALRVPAALVVVAAMVALAPRLAVPAGRAPLPAFFTGPAVERIPDGSVALLVPFPGPGGATPMTWAAYAGLRFRMPGGYFVGPDTDSSDASGAVGARYGAPPTALSGKLRQIAVGWQAPKQLDPYQRLAYSYDLAQWQARTVVIGLARTSEQRANYVKLFTELLGRPPSNVGGVYVWWDVQPQKLLDQAARSFR